MYIQTYCGCSYNTKYYRLVGVQLQLKTIKLIERNGILSPAIVWKPLRDVTLRSPTCSHTY